MNKNVIAITAYSKPDLLFLYLEQVYKSKRINDYLIRIYTEIGYDKEEDLVVSFYKNKFPQIDIKLICRPKHESCPLVGYHNILTSYCLAADEAAEYVIIGEEDMLPTDDYIEFNDYIYKNYLSKYDRIFCAAHKRRPEIEKNGNPEILIGDYQCTSPSCVSVKSIRKWLEPYFLTEGYFENPVGFNMRHFADSRISPFEHTHHDGAIERIMWKSKLFSLKPDQSRSMHVGLSGIFCKGKAPEGNLFERIIQWRSLIKDGNRLRSLSTTPQDMVVVDAKGPEWKDLHLDLNRDLAKASSWFYDSSNEFEKYINEKL